VIGLSVAAAALGAFGQVRGGQAAAAQGKFEQKVANQNAQIEDRNRIDAISRGETDQRNHYRRLAQAMGEARVRNSGLGLDTGFGSAASLEEDISLIGYEDSGALAENTNKEVMGYDINAANYRMQGAAASARGKAAKQAGYIGAAGTLLGAASQQASRNVDKGRTWYGGTKKPSGGSTGLYGGVNGTYGMGG